MKIKLRTRPGETQQEAKARIMKESKLQDLLGDDLYTIFEEANRQLLSADEVIEKLQTLYRNKYSGSYEMDGFMEDAAFIAGTYQNDHEQMVECFAQVVNTPLRHLP